MSTVHVDQDVNKYLVSAINRLKALPHVNVTKELTSHYNYGTEEPYVRDRFRIEMGRKTKDIRCLVVFDSSNYYSPPDIIFDKPVIINEVFDAEEQSVLLPAEDWDLKNENCLHNWVEKLVSRLKKPPKTPPPSPPPVPPSRTKQKNWGIFKLEDGSDDDFMISKEKADNDDDFIHMESNRNSRGNKSSNSINKRPANDQNDEAKDAKRLKKFKQLGECTTYNVIDLDEEIAESSVDSRQKIKKSCLDTDIGLKEEQKTKPQRRNPYIDEANAIDFKFDDKPKDTGLRDEGSKAKRSMATEKTKPKRRNPYIDETSTINFEFDDKPKDIERLKKNPYVDVFEQMEISKPEITRLKTIDLMQKKRRLTEAPSKVAAMRMQKEAKWGKDFMALWGKKFEQNIMRMDEKDTGSLTLYMTFRIVNAPGEWTRYSEDKQKRLKEFKEAQGMMPAEKIAQPKPQAPMLVHLELVSSTRLKVTLISAINTSEQASDGIDSIDLTYDLNQEHPVGFELTRIKNDIKKQAIYFHLFQTKLAD